MPKAHTKRKQPTAESPEPVIAEQLRGLIRAMLDAGLSMREIARRANVPATVVNKLMAGGTVYLDTAESLARALGNRLRL